MPLCIGSSQSVAVKRLVGIDAMRSLVALALFALQLGIPSVALALREESFGNEPQAAVPGWPQGLLEVVNLRSRVYFLGGDGPNICYFRGNAKDLQEALEKQCREGPAELARLQKLAIAQDLRELKKRIESAKK